jgi:5-methylthioadenosine/S-adenosylhomocysteine deaminase
MSHGVIAADHLITDAGGLLSPGWMEVRDGVIAQVKQGVPPDDAVLLAEAGGVVLPAFVNAHTHLALGFCSGIGDDLQFMDWLHHAMLPAIARATEDRQLYANGVAESAAELISGGVGTVADSFLDPTSVPLLAECGVRAFFGAEVFGLRQPDENAVLAEIATRALPRSGSDLVSVGWAPHSLFTCPPKILAAVGKRARAAGQRLTLHVDESPEEHEFFVRGTGPIADIVERFGASGRFKHGQSPVQVLAEMGLLGPDLLAVHAVQVTPEDIATLAATRTPVVTCPRSNMMLATGIAPVAEMIAAGVTVALGTDSLASTPDLDMFAEMRALLLSQRGRTRSTRGLAAVDAFHIATLGGARAMGLEKVTGRLAPGFSADCVRLEMPAQGRGRRDILARVVWEGARELVSHTFVAGHDLLGECSL